MGLSDSVSLSSLSVAVAALFFGLGAALIVSQNPNHKRPALTSFVIASIVVAAALVSFVITTLDLSMTKRYTIGIAGGALIGLFIVWISSVIGLVPEKAAVAQTSVQPSQNQNCTGNCSFNQSGGTVIQNINQEPQRLRFDPKLGEALTEQMAAKKLVLLKGIGSSNADQKVIQEYAQFLISKGFQVELFLIGMAIPAPNEKINLANSSDKYVLTIAPSAF